MEPDPSIEFSRMFAIDFSGNRFGKTYRLNNNYNS